VECLIELASTACLDSNQVPLSLLFVSVRALLERIRSKSFSSSSEDLAAFSQLTTLSSVRLWVECRQHPPFASPDSWPHLVLLELSNFCSGLVTQTAISNHAQASVERAFALVHKHACAQVPGVPPFDSSIRPLRYTKCYGTRFSPLFPARRRPL